MNAMSAEVVIVLVDTGDVVDVGTAKRWVGSELKHRQQMLGSLGKLQHGEANGVQPLAPFGNRGTQKRSAEGHNPLQFYHGTDLTAILLL